MPCSVVTWVKSLTTRDVRRRRLEPALHPFQHARWNVVRDGQPRLPARNDAFQTQILDRPHHRSTGHINAFATHLVSGLADGMNPVVPFPNPLDLSSEDLVALGHVIAKRGWGDRQMIADRLDPVA